MTIDDLVTRARLLAGETSTEFDEPLRAYVEEWLHPWADQIAKHAARRLREVREMPTDKHGRG